jgi:hypothetical protein
VRRRGSDPPTPDHHVCSLSPRLARPRPPPPPPNNPTQKCATNNFCARNRGRSGTRYAVLPGSLAILDGGRALHAVLQDRSGGAGAPSPPHFNLTLRAYAGPMVRLLVDEFPAPPADDKDAAAAAGAAAAAKKEGEGDAAAGDDSAAAEAAPPPPAPPSVLSAEARRRLPRYQLPDILEPGLESGPPVRWSRAQETKHTWLAAVEDHGSSRAVVRLTFDPFKLELWVVDEEGEGGGGERGGNPTTAPAPLAAPTSKPSAVVNGRSMFHVERTRREGPQPNDPQGYWEETFNGHSDSKPRGPQAISLDLSFPGSRHLYGLPSRATALALRPTALSSPIDKPPAGSLYSEPYRLYNLDVFEYLDDSPFGLYGSIPYLVAHRVEEGGSGGGGGGGGGNKNAAAGGTNRPSTTVGAAWINAAEQYVDISSAKDGSSAQWIAESGVLDLFLLGGPSPADVSKQLAAVAGATAMPQYFSLGYHQCRWNYKDEDDVTSVDAGFDAHAIPYDVLWLDIEHTDGKR